MEVMFGEISLKLRQTNWNVARNNIDFVIDETTVPSVNCYVLLWFCLDLVSEYNNFSPQSNSF